MNIPNTLTLIRFMLIPVFYIVYFSSMNNSYAISIIIFMVSGITDILDGYIARKYNLVTKWGIIMDPLADKLMIITVLYCLSRDNILPEWVFILVLIKELLMVIGGVNLLRYKRVVPSKYYGKAATVLFYVSIGIIVFNKSTGNYMLYAAIIMALFALYNYIVTFLRIFKDERYKKNTNKEE